MNTFDVEREEDIEQSLALHERASNDDLLKFLRRLPMMASNAKGLLKLADFIYEMKLWPFEKEAWSEVEGSAGVADCFIQINRVDKLAA